MKTTSDKWPFGEYPEKAFFNWLQKRYKMHKKGHEDTVIVVCGGEQIGKSRWTLRAEFALDPDSWLKDGKPDVERIVFTGKDYRYNVTHNKKSIIQDDEAITHFYSRKAMSEDNVMCNQTLAQCGYRHNIQFILIPDFFVLDTYIRTHRVHACVKIYPNNKFKTWVFTKKRKKLKQILTNKSFNVKPSSVGWWSENHNPDIFNAFVKAYRAKEHSFKKKSGERQAKVEVKPKTEREIKMQIAHNMYKTGNYTQKELAETFGISRQQIITWFKKLVNK